MSRGVATECIECERKLAPEPGTAGLCPSCRDQRYPTFVARRGDRWSPLALGVLSLVCDVIFIPTILTIVRAIGELREVGRREAEGLWSDEHPTVRTGAVFGIVLAAVRPAVIVFAFAVAGLAAHMAPHDVSVSYDGGDELDEIFAMMQSDTESERALALRQFEELAPLLPAAATRRSIDRAAEGFELPPPEDARTRSAIVRALLPHGRAPVARLHRVYLLLDSGGRGEVLRTTLHDSSVAGVDTMLDFLEREVDGTLAVEDRPIERLVELREHAAHYLPRLLDLPSEHVGRSVGISVAETICARSEEPGTLTAVGSAILVDWASARADMAGVPSGDAPARLAALDRGRRALALLGCVEGRDVGVILAQAASSPEPELAAAAVDAMQRRGDRVSPSAIRRAARGGSSRPAVQFRIPATRDPSQAEVRR